MPESTGYLSLADRAAWRAWLENHHSDATHVWLVHTKKGIRAGTLTYEEAVEEALCFGWIDGQLRRIDSEKYALRYSPRRANSIWSESNKRRVKRLIREGRMTQAGLDKVAEAKRNGQWEAATRREEVNAIPSELERALRRHKGALARYRALPASQKKQYLYWMMSAKSADTRTRRIRAILDAVTKSGQPRRG